MTSATAMTEAWAVEPPVNSRVVAFLKFSARVVALFAVAGAGLVLAGWVLNVNRLKSVIPGLVAMNPATAVAFILSGMAVWLEARDTIPGAASPDFSERSLPLSVSSN